METQKTPNSQSSLEAKKGLALINQVVIALSFVQPPLHCLPWATFSGVFSGHLLWTICESVLWFEGVMSWLNKVGMIHLGASGKLCIPVVSEWGWTPCRAGVEGPRISPWKEL